MRKANSFSMPASSGPYSLRSPVEFPDGMICTRVRLEVTLTLKNNGAVAASLRGMDLYFWVKLLFASFTLGFGAAVREIVDDAIGWEDLIQMTDKLTGRYPLVYAPGDGWVPMSPVTGWGETLDLTTDTANVQPGATHQFKFQAVRSFEYMRSDGERILDLCPGPSQMRQIHISGNRADGNPAAASLHDGQPWVQDGPADCTVYFDTEPSADNRWVRVPRLYRNDEAGLVQDGPEGALLALWEASAAGVDSALGLFSLRRGDGSEIHSQIEASRVVEDAAWKQQLGANDPNATVTVLYQPEAKTRLADIPTSHKWSLVQHSQDLSPMKSRWLYVPPSTKDYADRVGSNLHAGGIPVAKLTPAKAGDPTIPKNILPVTGYRVLTPRDVDFALHPGRIESENRTPENHIPDAVVRGARSAAENSGIVAQPSRLRSEASVISRYLPGGHSMATREAQATPTQKGVLAIISPSTEATSQALVATKVGA